MKKFLLALILVLIASSVYAKDFVDSGILTYLGTTEGEFQEGLDDLRKAVAPLIPADESNWAEEDRLEGFIMELVKNRRVVHFYDSLLSMQMALRSRKIDEIVLPEPVGMYLITNNANYDISFSLNMMPSTISFGFKQGNTKLQKEFNDAISAMRKDGTLSRLGKKFITELNGEPKAEKFTSFKDAETIKVAVTGDLPPIDYIAADGKPTGYNTAILSEIGRRIKKNVRLISVDSGGRSAALASGRADVIFWYRNTETSKIPSSKLKNVVRDAAPGVILSVPYYEWDTDLIITRSR
ncbi:MAG: transporter substrate-binding domain-containing protein [Synergistaceae bacterium]|nr:transporter substrate-binding domain-containing protein [Synergistaceae bacterium]MBR0202776.1 transporter substrate-binding domain-containing protein [Synergistaceae bacterium]